MMDESGDSRVSFIDFLEEWNKTQQMRTPEIHLKMAEWLERQWIGQKKRILLMAFRSAGKSTLVGLFAAWLLYHNPNIRILVLAADFALARKMVRNVKRIIEIHPLTRHLRPKKADEWAADYFTVKRNLALRDPSMLARGVTSNITGSRADIVICDDVEVPNTCDTDFKREELRNRLREMAYILVAGGTQIYVGTPHHYYSIYADVAREEIGEESEFLQNFERMSLPIIDEAGMSAWPERYDAKEIDRIRKETGENKFNSQMMLRPVNILNSRLNMDHLQYYKGEVEISKELGRLFIGHQKMRRSAAYWDPSMGYEKGDASVFAVMFQDEGFDLYLHHVVYLKSDRNSEKTEIEQQCDVVSEMAIRYQLPSLVVEGNSIGENFASALRRMLGRHGCSVFSRTNIENKNSRIVDAFEGVMAERRLFIHESVRSTPFLMEMREWRPGKHCRDDGLDAVAGAIVQFAKPPSEPVGPFSKPNWLKHTKPVQAKTGFDV